jgi:hypothetical protein
MLSVARSLIEMSGNSQQYGRDSLSFELLTAILCASYTNWGLQMENEGNPGLSRFAVILDDTAQDERTI